MTPTWPDMALICPRGHASLKGTGTPRPAMASPGPSWTSVHGSLSLQHLWHHACHRLALFLSKYFESKISPWVLSLLSALFWDALDFQARVSPPTPGPTALSSYFLSLPPISFLCSWAQNSTWRSGLPASHWIPSVLGFLPRIATA